MRFYLGVLHPNFMPQTDVPLFVSRRALASRRTLPRAKGPWALDSGGFTELSLHGRWETTPETYADEIRRFQADIGGLEWAAPQDWMCEPWVLAKTGLTVADHQHRTLRSYLDLAARGLPVVPVLQGWTGEDYARHAEQYEQAGVGLEGLPLVAIGSVCRRQGTLEAERIIRSLGRALRIHAFGLKVTGLRRFADALASADSMAWSYRARRGGIRLPGCRHRRCHNCLAWALRWREDVLRANLWMSQ